jgi:putative phage-type endonuclease
VDQGTKEWLDWKRNRIGSSDAATCMAMNDWCTPVQLWRRLVGLPVPEFKTNWAVQRGMRWEPAVRSRFELEFDMDFPPEIHTHPTYKRIIASLDGFNRDAEAILEIKVPGAAVINAAKDGTIDEPKYKRLAKEWKIASFCEGTGLVHPKYWPQIQHQAMVVGAKTIYFYVGEVDYVHGVETLINTYLVIAHPDPEFQKELLFKELQMLDFAAKNISPPLTDKDVVELDDEVSVLLCSELKRAKIELVAAEKALAAANEKMEEAELAFAELKDEVIHHLDKFEQRHTKYTCVGLSLTKTAKGNWVVRLKEVDEASAEVLNLKQG